MDRLSHYREIARSVISEYTRDRVSHGDIRTEGVIDPGREHYQVNHVGWDGPFARTGPGRYSGG